MRSAQAGSGGNHAGAFGHALRQRREEQGISLRGLARRVAYSPGWLSKIENGVAPPTTKLAELCDRELAADGELVALVCDGEVIPDTCVLPAQLPRNPSPFVGRVEELQELSQCLTSTRQDGRTVAVDGAPGVGKTALVTRWAHVASGDFSDGILYHDLGGYSGVGAPLVPAQVLECFLGALGVPRESVPYGTEARGAMFRSLVSGKQMLVVLDNAAGSHQVLPLLPGADSCAVVVTSRRRMTGVAARSGAVRLSLGPISTEESLELFSAVVGSDRIRGEPEGARSLAARCARLPLALRIAAERLATSEHQSLAVLADELAGPGDPEGRLDLLADGDGLAVRAAFEGSYCRLDTESSRAFRLLGLVSGQIVSTAAAATLLARPGSTARRLLEELVNVNLLAEVGPGQYRLEGLLLLFAAGRAAAEEAEDGRVAALRRLDSWSLRGAESASRIPVPYSAVESRGCR